MSERNASPVCEIRVARLRPEALALRTPNARIRRAAHALRGFTYSLKNLSGMGL